MRALAALSSQRVFPPLPPDFNVERREGLVRAAQKRALILQRSRPLSEATLRSGVRGARVVAGHARTRRQDTDGRVVADTPTRAFILQSPVPCTTLPHSLSNLPLASPMPCVPPPGPPSGAPPGAPGGGGAWGPPAAPLGPQGVPEQPQNNSRTIPEQLKNIWFFNCSWQTLFERGGRALGTSIWKPPWGAEQLKNPGFIIVLVVVP